MRRQMISIQLYFRRSSFVPPVMLSNMNEILAKEEFFLALHNTTWLYTNGVPE